MQRTAGRIALALFLTGLAAGTALADGCAFRVAGTTVGPLREREQVAFIAHRNGRETMALAIHTAEADEGDRGLWIFPVRGTPATTRLDLLERFPSLHGTDVSEKARARIGSALYTMRASQLWAVLPETFPTMGHAGFDVPVRAVDRWGLHSELIAATSTAELAATLARRGVKVPQEQLGTLQPYLNPSHTLVATWIASRKELAAHFTEAERAGTFTERAPAVLVEFATPAPFFPLRPTAFYGKEAVGARLFVAGYVSPKIAAGIGAERRVRYCVMPSAPAQIAPAGGAQPFRYTAVSFSVPAERYTDDLEFVPVDDPGRLRFAERVAGIDGVEPFPWAGVALVWIALFLLLSYLAAGIAGWSLGGGWRPYAPLGLWNVLTVVAVWRASIRAERQGRLPRRRKGSFELRFTIVFTILTWLAQFVLSLAV